MTFIKTEDETYRYINLSHVREIRIENPAGWNIYVATDLREVLVKSGYASEAAAQSAVEAMLGKIGWGTP